MIDKDELIRLLRDPAVMRILHEKADTDADKMAKHHTVGPKHTQVAAGSHVHGSDGYSTVSVPSTRYCLSTVGSNLVSVIGREAGDFHYDTTAGREYVLTGSPAVGGTPFSDNFDRADTANGSGLGGAWLSTISQPYRIKSNQAYPYVNTYGEQDHSDAIINVGSPNGYIEFRPNLIYSNLIFRANTVGTFYTYMPQSGQINRYSGGTFVATVGSTGAIVSPGDLVGVDYNGTTFRVYVNGVLRGTFTDGALSTGNYAGFFTLLTNAYAGENAVDNFAYTAGLGTLAWTPVDSNQEPVYAANAGSTITLPDYNIGSLHEITLTANCTLSFPSIATNGISFTLILIQDATGSRIVNWPGTVKWAGGTAPTLTTAASKKDVLSFMYDGTNWLGFVAGQNY